MAKPKHKIGDIVEFDDDFAFNPSNEVVSIGKVIGIHIYFGESIVTYKQLDGSFKCRDYSKRINYTLSGCSAIREQRFLRPYREDSYDQKETN